MKQLVILGAVASARSPGERGALETVAGDLRRLMHWARTRQAGLRYRLYGGPQIGFSSAVQDADWPCRERGLSRQLDGR